MSGFICGVLTRICKSSPTSIRHQADEYNLLLSAVCHSRIAIGSYSNFFTKLLANALARLYDQHWNGDDGRPHRGQRYINLFSVLHAERSTVPVVACQGLVAP